MIKRDRREKQILKGLGNVEWEWLTKNKDVYKRFLLDVQERMAAVLIETVLAKITPKGVKLKEEERRRVEENLRALLGIDQKSIEKLIHKMYKHISKARMSEEFLRETYSDIWDLLPETNEGITRELIIRLRIRKYGSLGRAFNYEITEFLGGVVYEAESDIKTISILTEYGIDMGEYIKKVRKAVLGAGESIYRVIREEYERAEV